MTSAIRRCGRHTPTVHTMEDRCPDCGEPTVQTVPPPFSPEDPHGAHRRRTRWTR